MGCGKKSLKNVEEKDIKKFELENNELHYSSNLVTEIYENNKKNFNDNIKLKINFNL